MGGQETNHLQYISAVENTSNYEAIPTPTLSGWGGFGVLSFRQKFKSSIMLNNIKIGIDKKATHLWNKRIY